MDKYISLKDSLKELNKDKYSLPIILGKDSNNDIHIKDLKDLKNILISGMTRSGKSVFLDSFLITTILNKSPQDVKFIMIDPKMGVEMEVYNGLPYLFIPVIHFMEEAYQILSWCLQEIERRVESNTTNPSIVIIIDEFADVMLDDQYKATRLETIIKEGGKVGIYTILSTSSPRDTVVTDTLQKYIKVRIAGALPSSADSTTVLGEQGAEDLLGSGDMIFKDMNTGEKVSVQTPFISTQETESIVSSISKENKPKAMEVKEIEEEKDPLYEEAKQLVIEKKQASPTFLQKHLKIGYNHAARLIEQLEKDRVITPEGKNRKREILLDNYEPSIEEEVIKEENVKNEQQKPAGDIIWLTKEQVRDALHAKEEFPIKEIELLPFLQSDIHHPEISISTLVSGILKVYDYEDSKMLNTVYDVDVSKQKVWYKDLLLALVATEPREEVIEKSILNILFTLREHHGNEYVLPLWKNAIIFFPTSRIFCDYTSIMMDYLFEHPKERNEKIYKELQDIFKKIKKEEVEPRIWESMVLTNYCLTDLLGNDKSKAPYLGDIKQENLLKAINERSCFDILFGEEYI